VAVSDFSCWKTCISDVDITFLKLNKISLVGFPHNGVFPSWLPNFWVYTWICDCCSLLFSAAIFLSNVCFSL
jgi:hypothetical protein